MMESHLGCAVNNLSLEVMKVQVMTGKSVFKTQMVGKATEAVAVI